MRATPEIRAGYCHFVYLTTRWMDTDVYGHLNNVVAYSLFDTAVNQTLIGTEALEIPGGPVIGLVVETGCTYLGPMRFPDRIAAGIRVARIGTTSVRYEVGLFRNEDERASAQGYFVHVYVDSRTHRPVALPDNLRRVLQGLQRV
jgi:acyl-CoA thioester hydrolase